MLFRGEQPTWGAIKTLEWNERSFAIKPICKNVGFDLWILRLVYE